MPGRRPTWGQVRRFCEKQGFRPSTTDHDYYDIVLPDGSTAGTKLSFNRAETEQVSPALWPRVWKRQLRLRSEDEFWRGLDGTPVAYDTPPAAESAAPLPDYLARHLREETQRLLNAWYSRDRDT